MSDLVGTHDDRFSRVVAYMMYLSFQPIVNLHLMDRDVDFLL